MDALNDDNNHHRNHINSQRPEQNLHPGRKFASPEARALLEGDQLIFFQSLCLGPCGSGAGGGYQHLHVIRLCVW